MVKVVLYPQAQIIYILFLFLYVYVYVYNVYIYMYICIYICIYVYIYEHFSNLIILVVHFAYHILLLLLTVPMYDQLGLGNSCTGYLHQIAYVWGQGSATAYFGLGNCNSFPRVGTPHKPYSRTEHVTFILLIMHHVWSLLKHCNM